MAKNECSVKVLSELLMLSERRVQQLVKEGVLPRKKIGKYDLVLCVQAYIKHLSDIVKNTDNTLESERRKFMKVKREKEEFNFAVLKMEYLKRTEIFRVVGGIIVTAKTKLRAATKRWAPQVSICGEVAENQSYLMKEVDAILRDLSAPKLSDFNRGRALFTMGSTSKSKPK